jgi:hypothetical protein
MNQKDLQHKNTRDNFVLTASNSGELPDGTYSGHFFLKESKGRRKVADSCTLRFTPNAAGGHNVAGSNSNEFGNNIVTGFVKDSKIFMWRVRDIDGISSHIAADQQQQQQLSGELQQTAAVYVAARRTRISAYGVYS